MTFHSPAKKKSTKTRKQVRKLGSILHDVIPEEQQGSSTYIRKSSFDFSLDNAFIPEYKKLKQPKQNLLEEPFIKYFSKHQRLENLVESLSQKMKVQEVERSKYLAKQVQYQNNKLEPATDNNPFLELFSWEKELKKLEEKPEHLRIFKVNIGE